MKTLWIALAVVVLLASLSWARGFRYGAVTVTTGTAVLIGSASARTVLNICNQDAANSIFCGDAAVTTANGMPVKAGLCSTITGVDIAASPVEFPVYCVATGASVDARYWEDLR